MPEIRERSFKSSEPINVLYFKLYSDQYSSMCCGINLRIENAGHPLSGWDHIEFSIYLLPMVKLLGSSVFFISLAPKV